MMMLGMTGGTITVAIAIRGGPIRRADDVPSAQNGLLPRGRAGGLDFRGKDGRKRQKIGERDHRDRAHKSPFFHRLV
ncbi:MAG: hypothetical protein P4L80_12985, partial [Xanthobacteraceae bacterium]|nr:hypothetical protein [Xanthobacteraceae bacterium]